MIHNWAACSFPHVVCVCAFNMWSLYAYACVACSPRYLFYVFVYWCVWNISYPVPPVTSACTTVVLTGVCGKNPWCRVSVCIFGDGRAHVVASQRTTRKTKQLPTIVLDQYSIRMRLMPSGNIILAFFRSSASLRPPYYSRYVSPISYLPASCAHATSCEILEPQIHYPSLWRYL